MLKKISLLLIVILTGCQYREDDTLRSKGIIVSIFESKEGAKTEVKISVQDTSGKVYFAKKSLCEKCSMGDSVRLVYHDNSLIEGSGDKLVVDSCIRFYNAVWIPERISKTLYFYNDSNRLVKKIDTIFIKK